MFAYLVMTQYRLLADSDFQGDLFWDLKNCRKTKTFTPIVYFAPYGNLERIGMSKMTEMYLAFFQTPQSGRILDFRRVRRSALAVRLTSPECLATALRNDVL